MLIGSYMRRHLKKEYKVKFDVQSIIDRLEAKPAVLHIPIGAEADFKGVIDLVEMKAHKVRKIL